MIPQSFKDIVSSGEYVGLLQTIAMLMFIVLFVGLTWYVLSRPKKHYNEEANAPLNDENNQINDEK